MSESAPRDLIITQKIIQLNYPTENLVAEMPHCSVGYLFLYEKAIDNENGKCVPSNNLLVLMKS